MLSSLLIIQRNILLRLVCKVGYTVYSSLNKIDPLVPLRLYDVIDRGFLISLGDVVSRHWPSFSYCGADFVWHPASAQDCKPLQQQLRWLPISERIKYNTAFIVLCTTHSQVLPLLSFWTTAPLLTVLPTVVSALRRQTQSCSNSNASIAKLMCVLKKLIFSHFGPHIWNNLPQGTSHSATLSSLENKLKIFHFSKYFI